MCCHLAMTVALGSKEQVAVVNFERRVKASPRAEEQGEDELEPIGQLFSHLYA